ncbi:hypothetical protein SAMN05216436_12446 [bacterium A37T11]|nr:hypothetical protein SAMN05216436_12446 [bacterium A37T11]
MILPDDSSIARINKAMIKEAMSTTTAELCKEDQLGQETF